MTEFIQTAPLFATKLAVVALAYTAVAAAATTLTQQLKSVSLRHHILRVVVLGAILLPTVTLFLPSAPTSTTSPTTASFSLAFTPLAIASSVWLLGSLSLLARLALGSFKLRTLRDLSTPADRSYRDLFDASRRRMAIHHPVQIVFSDVSSPFVSGLHRPVIFLPLEAIAWSAPLLRSAVTHELAHIARRDLLWGTITAAVTTLFWWNPAAWWLARHLVHQRETLCDQLAVERSGLGTQTYAHALIEICSRTSSHRPSAIAAAIRHGSLEDRIRHLCPDRHLQPAPTSPLSKATLTLTSAALFFLAVVACNVATSLRTSPPAWNDIEVDARWAADPFPANP